MTAKTAPYLVKLDKASVRLSNQTVLRDISFTLEPGRNWIVLGNNGSGKTTFLSLLRGDVWPVHPERSPRVYNSGPRPQTSPIGFRKKTGWMSAELLNLYHTRQVNISCLECIASGARNAARLTRPMDDHLHQRVQDLAFRLDITDLLPRKLLSLSNGQAHKVLLARSLIHEPSVLFLDEAFAGLDQASRAKLHDLLADLARQGTQMIMATHNPKDVQDCFDSVLHLENGRIMDTGPADHVQQDALLQRPPISPGQAHPASSQKDQGEPLVAVSRATVSRQLTPVLKDITWTIRKGEHWAVTGPNGSGKSTLLRLILGELHSYPGGSVIRFGSSDPIPIWDLKTSIGFFSPELQSRHTRLQTVLDTVVSGLRGHEGLHQPATPSEMHLALDLLDEHGLRFLENRNVQHLSNGQQRLVFLLRAMVNTPPLLLLDEPCSGLDRDNRHCLLKSIELLARRRTQIVMVSHSHEDHIPSINRWLRLENGRIVEMTQPSPVESLFNSSS